MSNLCLCDPGDGWRRLSMLPLPRFLGLSLDLGSFLSRNCICTPCHRSPTSHPLWVLWPSQRGLSAPFFRCGASGPTSCIGPHAPPSFTPASPNQPLSQPSREASPPRHKPCSCARPRLSQVLGSLLHKEPSSLEPGHQSWPIPSPPHPGPGRGSSPGPAPATATQSALSHTCRLH